jgi:hypothetical protein
LYAIVIPCLAVHLFMEDVCFTVNALTDAPREGLYPIVFFMTIIEMKGSGGEMMENGVY